MKKYLYLSFFLIIGINTSIIAQDPIEDLYGSWSGYEFANICGQAWNYYNQFDIVISPVNTSGQVDTISINFQIGTASMDTSFTTKFAISTGTSNYPLISIEESPLSVFYNTLSLNKENSLIFTSSEACLACDCGTITYLIKTSSNNNINLINDWLISPNPTSNLINISFNKHSVAQLSLFNANGQLTKSFQIEGPEEKISLEGLEEGLYYLQIQTNEGVGIQKIIKAN